MLSFPVERTQVDGRQLEFSLAGSVQFDPKSDMTRQEFKDEADINLMMKRAFAGVDFRPRDNVGGVVDFDADLHSAFSSVRQLREAYASLPVHVQEKYPTFELFCGAVGNGEDVFYKEPPKAPDVKPDAVPA